MWSAGWYYSPCWYGGGCYGYTSPYCGPVITYSYCPPCVRYCGCGC